MGRNVTVWPKRPFKITYYTGKNPNLEKVGRVDACSSPEAVVRSSSLAVISGRAEMASVYMEEYLFAAMIRQSDGAIRFSVF